MESQLFPALFVLVPTGLGILLLLAIWHRRDGKGVNVTFPARQFTVGGDRRSFSLVRYVDNPAAQDRLRDFLLQAYQADTQEVESAAR